MKYLPIIAATLLATTAHANTITSANNYAISLEHTNYNAKADGDKANLAGVAISIDKQFTNNGGLFAKLSHTKADKLNSKLTTVSSGYQHTIYNQGGAYVLGRIGLGYGILELDTLNIDNDFIAIPTSIEVGYKPTQKFSVFANAGYQYAFNLTSDTTCRDGSQSNSTGQGTCSWHGGIAYYNDNLGNAHGATFGAGVKYHF